MGNRTSNRRLTLLRPIAAALSLGLATAALADDLGAGYSYTRDDYPYDELVRQPLTAAPGEIRLTVPLTVDLSKDRAFEKPYWVPASVYMGVNDWLTVGLVNDVYANGGRAGLIGGFCLGGDSVCARVWNNLGAEAAISFFRAGPMQAVVDAGLYAVDFDDVHYDARLGLAFKMSLGRAAVVAKGSLIEAVNKRDGVEMRGNVMLSAEAQLQLAKGIGIFGRLEYLDAFDLAQSVSSADAWLPFTVGALLTPMPRLDVGALFRVQNAFGQGATFDGRQGQLFFRFHI